MNFLMRHIVNVCTYSDRLSRPQRKTVTDNKKENFVCTRKEKFWALFTESVRDFHLQ